MVSGAFIGACISSSGARSACLQGAFIGAKAKICGDEDDCDFKGTPTLKILGLQYDLEELEDVRIDDTACDWFGARAQRTTRLRGVWSSVKAISCRCPYRCFCGLELLGP